MLNTTAARLSSGGLVLFYKAPTNPLWKSICSTVDLVASRACHKFGDGHSTLLWKDSRINCGVLEIAFPRLFRLTYSPFVVVVVVWVADTIAWDLRLHRNLNDQVVD